MIRRRNYGTPENPLDALKGTIARAMGDLDDDASSLVLWCHEIVKAIARVPDDDLEHGFVIINEHGGDFKEALDWSTILQLSPDELGEFFNQAPGLQFPLMPDSQDKFFDPKVLRDFQDKFFDEKGLKSKRARTE